jgi:hypothetical protein
MCWRQGAEGPWVLVDLYWRAWCCGVLGDGWPEVMLYLQFQISKYLVEEAEARPPCRVVRDQWFFYGAAARVF